MPRSIQIEREWLMPSDVYGWNAILRNATPLPTLLWLASLLAGVNPIAPFALSPAIGLVMYRLTLVMHDCTHRTLFTSRSLNERVGLLVGAVTGIDFRTFSDQHWRHHKIFGERDDPQGFHYVELRRMSRRQYRWHVFKPLLGVNLRWTLPDSVLAPRNWRRNLFSKYGIVVVSSQLGIWSLVTGFWSHPYLVVLPFVSSATFGLFFSQLRGIVEHGVIGREASAGFMRSHRVHWLDRILLYDLDFNYHREHHEYPQVPSCHLHKLHWATPDQSPLSDSMFGTLRQIDGQLGEDRGET